MRQTVNGNQHQEMKSLQPEMATILEIDTSRLVTKTLHCYNDHGKHTLVYLPMFACFILCYLGVYMLVDG